MDISLFSLDVVSMYTNVETEEAVKATTNMLIENKIDLRGLHINDVKVLLNFMLKNNFFEFQGHYFLQHRNGLWDPESHPYWQLWLSTNLSVPPSTAQYPAQFPSTKDILTHSFCSSPTKKQKPYCSE